jgi:hypothetical protein
MPRVDTEDASKFGTIRPILSSEDMVSMAPGPALRRMYRALADGYRPGDSILYAPADPLVPLLAGLALHAAGATRDDLRWLRWERRGRNETRDDDSNGNRQGFYVPTIINARPLFGFEDRE